MQVDSLSTLCFTPSCAHLKAKEKGSDKKRNLYHDALKMPVRAVAEVPTLRGLEKEGALLHMIYEERQNTE